MCFTFKNIFVGCVLWYDDESFIELFSYIIFVFLRVTF